MSIHTKEEDQDTVRMQELMALLGYGWMSDNMKHN
jgi:hypothetical protein